MIQPLDQSIIELLNASRDDEQNLAFPVNDRSFGFHTQQALEKLLKVLIGAHDQKYKYTHDLEELLGTLQTLGEHLPIEASLIVKLTDYAGIWRYVEPEPLLPEQRVALTRAVVDLRGHTLRRLSVLRPGVIWADFS